MKESTVEKAIRRYAEEHGCIALKLAPGNGDNGKPDRLILAANGRSMFLEVKKPGETPTSLQRWWQRRLRDIGHVSEWCDNAPDGIRLVRRHLLK